MKGDNGQPNGERREASPAADVVLRRRTPWPLMVVAALFVVVPFLAWYGTWFGRELSDEQIEEYLRDGDKPRRVQHALSQVEKRIAAGHTDAKRWYGSVIALADSPEKELRLTAAWVMGADARSDEFHEKLLRLVGDGEPIVRRNAALSLVGFGDTRCLPELRAMLRPHAVRSDAEGTALTALTEGSVVRRDAMLMRYTAKTGDDRHDVRSPLDGKIERAAVKSGASFRAGEELFVLAPDAVSVGDALVGLERLGLKEDLAEVERYARGVEGMPEYVKKRAALTAEAIKRRANENQSSSSQ